MYSARLHLDCLLALLHRELVFPRGLRILHSWVFSPGAVLSEWENISLLRPQECVCAAF